MAKRTQEIRIRLVLGAERARTVGILGGSIGAWAATRLIAGLLYGVEVTDVPTFVMATITLTAVAFFA